VTLREKLFNAIWRCGFAPHEDPATVERMKAEWPDDVRAAYRRADAILAMLADEGLVVVPSEPTVGMFRALTLSQVGNDDQNYRLGCWALGSFAADYAAMISAAPDALETKP
jgi:hypothetical protein